jgi:MFS superfamily sulfate permease-like transporter
MRETNIPPTMALRIPAIGGKPEAIAIPKLRGKAIKKTRKPEIKSYRYTLAAIVVAGILQIVIGFLKLGSLSSFFPTSVVHGMLAAIGIIIITKQIHVMLGATPEPGSLFSSMAQVPHSIMNMNSEIAFIGIVGLLIMILWSRLQQPLLKKIPAPIIVVLLGIGLGMYFDLNHTHIYHVQRNAMNYFRK